MKKVFMLILIIFCAVFVGCENDAELFSREYIQSMQGRFCNEYAVTSIFEEGWNADIMTVYKSVDHNDYVKLFDTKESSFFGNIIATKDNIYFIYMKSQLGLSINAYKLEDGTSFSSTTGDNDIFEIESTYGIKDNYIYLKYKKYIWTSDNGIIANKYRKEVDGYFYGRISLDLSVFEEIKENDIPTSFDYSSC